MILNETKFLKKLFESNENPVVANGEQDKDRFHLEDYIQYYNKPGIIVATIRGNTDTSLQQLPVGAVDNFRFMKVTDENAIANQDKNNGKTYDMILKEYEGTKNGIIDSWKKGNMSKLQGVMNKYGDKFLGLDIVQNEKQIQHKLSDEEKAQQKEEQGDDKGRDAEELKEIDKDTPNNGEKTNEGIMRNIMDKFASLGKATKDFIVSSAKNAATGLGNAINSPFAQKSVKMLAAAIDTMGDNVDEQTKFQINDMGKIHGIQSLRVAKIGNGFYITLFYDGQTDDKSNCATLKNLGDELESSSIKQMTREIRGIVAFPKTEDQIAGKQQSNDQQNNVNEDKNYTLQDTYRPIVNVKYENGVIGFIVEKSKAEVNKEKSRRNLYK